MAPCLSLLLPLVLGGALGAVLVTLTRRFRRAPHPAAPPELSPVAIPETGSNGADALVLIDVDAMAAMNADYGPDVGDRTLERIADVVRRALPPGAAQERLDGGRFVLWLSGQDEAGAANVAETMRSLTAQATVEVGRKRVGRTISAGVVQLSGAEGRARALMAAETALKRAKRQGGNRVAIASPPVPPKGPSASDVQEAIKSGAIGYYVQPIFDLNTGAPWGVEALLRWTLPDGRVLPPTDFLHRVETLPEDAAALFVDLAVEAARPFVEGDNPLRFSLNLTAGALDGSDSQSKAWLHNVLSRLPAERMMLELLESAVVTDPVKATAAARAIQSTGCWIALDDFGTGLSNLDRALAIQPEVIKLDRCFVRDLGESGKPEALLRSMVRLADDLDAILIAEGLETAADAEIVRALGILRGQGYHLGYPEPVSYWAEKLR